MQSLCRADTDAPPWRRRAQNRRVFVGFCRCCCCRRPRATGPPPNCGAAP